MKACPECNVVGKHHPTCPRFKTLHILNLGAGVQSTELYLLSMRGEIQRFDFAIFADTQDEPGGEERRRMKPDPPESVYAHLDWLATQAEYLDSKSPLVPSSRHNGKGCPILVRTRGQISADLLRGENSTGQRLASIPAFTAEAEGGKEGMLRRQCTNEYKIEVIERTIRRELLNLRPRQHTPKDVMIHQYIGISWDERSRAFDIEHKVFSHKPKNWVCGFPLLTMNGEISAGWTREDCERDLKKHVPHKVFGSACTFCPYQDDETWQRRMEPGPTRDNLIQIDTGIRTPGTILNRGLNQQLYLHRSCRPLTAIDFSEQDDRQLSFAMECEGGCGL